MEKGCGLEAEGRSAAARSGESPPSFVCAHPSAYRKRLGPDFLLLLLLLLPPSPTSAHPDFAYSAPNRPEVRTTTGSVEPHSTP